MFLLSDNKVNVNKNSGLPYCFPTLFFRWRLTAWACSWGVLPRVTIRWEWHGHVNDQTPKHGS